MFIRVYVGICAVSIIWSCAWLFIGCGEVKEIPDEIVIIDDNKPDATPTAQSNPLCEGVQDFTDGTLWKPVSDGGGPEFSGNPVFLISNKFEKQFEKCAVELKDGTMHELRCIDNAPWTHTPFSCFSNGERQTWRVGVAAKSVKRDAKIYCEELTQTCVFQFRGRPVDRHE